MRRVYLLLAVLAVVGGSVWLSAVRVRREAKLPAGATCIFSDRSHPKLEFAYIVRSDKLFIQAAMFPPYSERKWYHIDKLAEEDIRKFELWGVRDGTIGPPFEPGGPWFSRSTIQKAGLKDRAFFANTDQAALDFFAMMRSHFVDEKYRVKELPVWIADDADLKAAIVLPEPGR